MAVDELGADVVGDLLHAEDVLLLLDAGVEDHLQQYVAQLLPEQDGILGVDGLDDLVGLLDEVVADGLVGLLHVPGTAALGAKQLHDGHQILKGIGGGLFQQVADVGITLFFGQSIHDVVPSFLSIGNCFPSKRAVRSPAPYRQATQATEATV